MGLPVPVDRGDVLGDVLKYWSYITANPRFLFQATAKWELEPLVLSSGAYQIFANFTEFIEMERNKQAVIDGKLVDDGLDLLNQDGININDIDPEIPEEQPREEARDDEPEEEEEEREEDGLMILTKVGGDIKPSRISQGAFWDVTKYLIPSVKKHGSCVVLPNRYEMLTCLRRLSQRIHVATADLRPRLEEVPTAYNDAQHHTLYLVITPYMRKSGLQAETLFSIFNITAQGGVYDATAQKTTLFYKELPHLHPMFEQECWCDLLFKVAMLATQKCMFINFNFHVGLHYQYLDVFEQCLELVHQAEIDTVGGMTTGAITSRFKTAVEEEDYESGRSPLWIYEFDIPDEYRQGAANGEGELKHIASVLPTYKGMRVRFMFRQDHSAWFF